MQVIFHLIQYIMQNINCMFGCFICTIDLTIDACPENKKVIVLKEFLFEMYQFVLKINTKLFE